MKLGVTSQRAGIEWKKRAESRKWGKKRKLPTPTNGEKMSPKWCQNGIWGRFTIFGPFSPHAWPWAISYSAAFLSRFRFSARFFRKILVSVKFLSAILAPEMGAPILWTPGKMRPFCRKTRVHKIPRFFGGGVFWVFWGGECRFYFMGARIFLIFPFFSNRLTCKLFVARQPATVDTIVSIGP